jgi:CubicO group peptidase (beta-lactamase class C family)
VSEAWYRLTLDREPGPGHGIRGIVFGFADRPLDAVAHGRLRQDQIITQMRAYLKKLAAAEMLSGSVLITGRGGKLLVHQTYPAGRHDGSAEPEWDMASLVKMFTSVAVAQLVERGRLSYDDTIGQHLPDYPNATAAASVKIRHLLTHTSGLAEYSEKPQYRPARRAGGGGFLKLTDWFAFFARDPLVFPPGTKSDYNNSGFIVLGAIVEKASGQNYFDYVQQHIFRPAGMTHTHLTVATGNSAGGGLSTTEDLCKFGEALRRHKFLNKHSTEEILKPRVRTGENEWYGFGFEVVAARGRRVVGHSGGGEADNQLDLYLDDGYTLVALSKPYAARHITRKFRELVWQE